MQAVLFNTARRSYEFGLDRVRISAVVTETVLQQVKSEFQFQIGTVASPVPTFGTVGAAIPPGVVFNYGSLSPTEGQIIPIRFIHFEPTRLVIDVAGRSSDIDKVYERLNDALSRTSLTVGQIIDGDPRAVKEYSELVATFDVSLEEAFVPNFRRTVAMHATGPDALLAVGVSLEWLLRGEEYNGTGIGYLLQPRAGRPLEEHSYFSSAPLSTEAHHSFLTALERELTGR